MNNQNDPSAKATDIDPLVPLDVIRPPQQRGTDDVQLDVIPPLEPEEMPEAEIAELQKEDAKAPKYKGNVNAPVDAEHPLANPPSGDDGRLEAENPRD